MPTELHLKLSDGARDGMADALEKTLVPGTVFDSIALDLRALSVFVLEAFCANASLTDWDRLQEHGHHH